MPSRHPNTRRNTWPHKSLPSHEWPITGLPETPATTTLTTHRSVARYVLRATNRGMLRCPALRATRAVWVRVGSGHVLDGYYCDVVIVRAIANEGFEQGVDVLVR